MKESDSTQVELQFTKPTYRNMEKEVRRSMGKGSLTGGLWVILQTITPLKNPNVPEGVTRSPGCLGGDFHFSPSMRSSVWNAR